MKKWMVLMGLLLAGATPASWASDAALPRAENFRNDARQAQHQRLAVLVFFSAKSCQYCESMRELFLGPMFASGDYSNKVIMREVQVDSGRELRDFEGKRISHRDFALRYRVGLTPQIWFLDPAGKELIPALVGLGTPELFGSYLDAAIDMAVASMRVAPP